MKIYRKLIKNESSLIYDTCSIASPLLTIETPQFPFWYFSPLYLAPVGVVITHFEKGN